MHGKKDSSRNTYQSKQNELSIKRPTGSSHCAREPGSLRAPGDVSATTTSGLVTLGRWML